MNHDKNWKVRLFNINCLIVFNKRSTTEPPWSFTLSRNTYIVIKVKLFEKNTHRQAVKCQVNIQMNGTQSCRCHVKTTSSTRGLSKKHLQLSVIFSSISCFDKKKSLQFVGLIAYNNDLCTLICQWAFKRSPNLL